MPSPSECWRSVHYHGPRAVAALHRTLDALTEKEADRWLQEAIFHARNAGHYGKIIVGGFKPAALAIAEAEAEAEAEATLRANSQPLKTAA